MHSYMRNKEQRAVFDHAVECAVLAGNATNSSIAEHTRRTLLKLPETWTKVLARSASFDKSVYSALRRLLVDGRVTHKIIGRTAHWSATYARTEQAELQAP